MRRGRQEARDRLPVPRLVLPAGRFAARRAQLPRRRGLRPRRVRVDRAALPGVARLAVRRRVRAGRLVRRARRRARGDRRAVRTRRAAGRRHPRVRDRGQLEDRRGELPGVLPLLDDPSRAVPGEPAGQRRQPRPARRLGRRLDVAARRGRHHVARRPVARDRDRRPLRHRAAHRHVRRAVPQPAGEPAPRLRDDPPAGPAGGRPHLDRVRLAVPGRDRRAGRLRPVVRRRLLGPHQPPGLVGLRVGAARTDQRARPARDRWRPRRTACSSSSRGSPAATWVSPSRPGRRSRPRGRSRPRSPRRSPPAARRTGPGRAPRGRRGTPAPAARSTPRARSPRRCPRCTR